MVDFDTAAPVPVPADKIAQHLRDNRGNLSLTCRTLADFGFPISRKSLKNRIDSSPELREVLDDVRDDILDQAESNVYDDVFAKDPGASRFVLTTLGKERGWVTRQEQSNKEPIQIIVKDFNDENQ